MYIVSNGLNFWEQKKDTIVPVNFYVILLNYVQFLFNDDILSTLRLIMLLYLNDITLGD